MGLIEWDGDSDDTGDDDVGDDVGGDADGAGEEAAPADADADGAAVPDGQDDAGDDGPDAVEDLLTGQHAFIAALESELEKEGKDSFSVKDPAGLVKSLPIEAQELIVNMRRRMGRAAEEAAAAKKEAAAMKKDAEERAATVDERDAAIHSLFSDPKFKKIFADMEPKEGPPKDPYSEEGIAYYARKEAARLVQEAMGTFFGEVDTYSKDRQKAAEEARAEAARTARVQELEKFRAESPHFDDLYDDIKEMVKGSGGYITAERAYGILVREKGLDAKAAPPNAAARSAARARSRKGGRGGSPPPPPPPENATNEELYRYFEENPEARDQVWR